MSKLKKRVLAWNLLSRKIKRSSENKKMCQRSIQDYAVGVNEICSWPRDVESLRCPWPMTSCCRHHLSNVFGDASCKHSWLASICRDFRTSGLKLCLRMHQLVIHMPRTSASRSLGQDFKSQFLISFFSPFPAILCGDLAPRQNGARLHDNIMISDFGRI